MGWIWCPPEWRVKAPGLCAPAAVLGLAHQRRHAAGDLQRHRGGDLRRRHHLFLHRLHPVPLPHGGHTADTPHALQGVAGMQTPVRMLLFACRAGGSSVFKGPLQGKGQCCGRRLPSAHRDVVLGALQSRGRCKPSYGSVGRTDPTTHTGPPMGGFAQGKPVAADDHV